MARAVETIVTAQLCKWRPALQVQETLTQRGLCSCEPSGYVAEAHMLLPLHLLVVFHSTPLSIRCWVRRTDAEDPIRAKDHF